MTSEVCLNWIPERNLVSVEGRGTDVHDKNERCSLVRTPGLLNFVTLPQTPVRGVFPGDGRLFAAAGSHFYEILSNATYIDRSVPGFTGASGIGPSGSTIGNDSKPVLGFFNGNQILLISAGYAYCDNGNGPVQCQFSDPLTDLVVDPGDASGKTLTTATGGFFDASDVGRTIQITGGSGFNLISQPILSITTPLQYTDLQIVIQPNIIYSPSHPFSTADVGNQITITGGTGFTPGVYKITGVVYSAGGTPTSNVILSSNVGTVGSVGGTGYQHQGGEAVGASAWGTPGASLGTGIEWLGNITFTDLQVVIQPNIVYSASHPFSSSDIGLQLTITSGTGFTPGTYTITGLVYSASGQPTGNAILDRNVGTVGSTGGHGTQQSELVTASYGAFMDGYFFVAPNPPTKNIFFSDLAPPTGLGGVSWTPLDFFVKGNYPDNVAALFADHEELYTFGDLESTQVWRNIGQELTPFLPDPGAVMHVGCIAPFSVVRLGNGVAWLGGDVRRGVRRAYHAVGYNPVAVSTPAVEAQWAGYSTVADAVAYTFMDQGHESWIINFPTANATWAFDANTGWWHQRGYWNGSSWDRIRTWVHCVVKFPTGTDVHYGGDWQNGNVYVVSRQYKTDNGTMIVRRRQAPHLTVENMRRFYSRFEIDCDVLGLQRIFWNRLGNGRDRIWRLDSQQPSETAGVTLTLGYSDDRTQSFQTFFTQTLDPSVDVRLSNAYLNWVDATWH